ncbi:hypothetical protein EDD37DRAFT_468364 [Exophiala viscosa]|uniref:uncharacterized protein n=1 Tax=Exophiala viscosa TaxID=2486360 RepID=UPI0021920455|nr:hypothetical protein EDD37DRAFT_468364 [Exophiala viscosa]
MLTRVFFGISLTAFLFNAAFAQDAGQWIIPNSAEANFTDVYNNGNSITWSWQGMNHSLSDLWLTSYDPTLSYALRVAANINITGPGTLPWTITVNDTQIDIDDRFCLRFVLTGTDIFPFQTDQFPSPAFLILQQGQTLPATTASTSTASATSTSTASSQTTTTISSSSSTSSSSTPRPPSKPTLSAGAKAGIGVGAAAVFLIILALLFVVLRLYRRVKAASNQHSQGIIPEHSEGTSPTTPSTLPVIKQISGLHEALGDRRHPTELSVKQEKAVVHELPG